MRISPRRRKRQLALTYGLGGAVQSLADIGFQVRVGGEDVLLAHSVGHHPHRRRHGYAQTANAGDAAPSGLVFLPGSWRSVILAKCIATSVRRP